MHWLVPYFVNDSPEARAALARAPLPALRRLLRDAQGVAAGRADEGSLLSGDEHFALTQVDADLSGTSSAVALQRHWAGLPAAGGWGELRLVHWQVGRDDIVLHPQFDLAVNEQEHAALEHDIASLLRDEGLQLHAQAPGCWHVQGALLEQLHTAAFARAAGRDLRTFAARGPQAKRWRRIEGELQMLLYTHAVNAARDAAGQRTVNAVWLSGTGALPAAAAARPAWQVQAAQVPFLIGQYTNEYIDLMDKMFAATAITSTEYVTFCGENAWLTLRHAPRKAPWRWFGAAGLTLEALIDKL